MESPKNGADDKRDAKPPRILNRVPRACNACRKQKMRCEGADNPPCKRCRNTGLECLFEKPSREASLTGEAGLERIRSLETHVADIRVTQQSIRENQMSMQNSLNQLLAELRGNRYQPGYNRSPSLASPSVTTPTASHVQANEVHSGSHQLPFPAQARRMSYSSHSMSPAPPSQDFQSHQNSQQGQGFQHSSQGFSTSNAPGSHQTNLPPLSSLQSIGFQPSPAPNNVSAMRFQPSEGQHSSSSRLPYQASFAGAKRSAGISKMTSPSSSDVEDEDSGDLPARGLVAPLQVLQGLADVALRHARSGEPPSEAPSRAPSPGRQSRPAKRRKLEVSTPKPSFADVVTKGIITDQEARDLFRIFYNGCSTFLPVFDNNADAFDALHERSPFAVNSICMAAARVRDGGGPPSDTYTKILDEVQHISRYTLFSPVTRYEAVQSMLIIAGWSDNGWLCGGHAVRMAMEVTLEKSWPRLRKRIINHKADASSDRDLVTGTRSWFCLYLYEHQISYGTGRPAILRDDDSIGDCRLFLQHPAAVEDDMRLISTVELMALRESVQNRMGPLDQPIQERHFAVLHEADQQFRRWFENWDQLFSQKYEDAAFYRQSLQIQQIFALLYHNASALTGINGPNDVQHIPPYQRDLVLKCINLAMAGLDIIANSSTYRQGMKYAVNYTHASATFAASFLLRLARLFPNDCDVGKIRQHVESLSNLMSEIPGKRYALTLQMMLKRARKRSMSSSTELRSQALPQPQPQLHTAQQPQVSGSGQSYSSAYSGSFPPHSPETPIHPNQHHGLPQGYFSGPNYQQPAPEAEAMFQPFEGMPNDQLPVWLSDQTMGGKSLSQNGMEAFFLPTAFMPAPQIW